ncbi:phosphatase PAP2 family protein [Luteimicrobium sp. NPDC057192]|uniref:phosphatase PAP2 family protein n=1 Tax=Luteimicrobium sp. NPDC057192 TaxID=3346042 RepID=UPI00362E44F9
MRGSLSLRAFVLPAVVLVPFVVLLVAVLAVGGDPLGVDTWWAGVVAGWHAPGVTPGARLVSDLGGGVVGGVEIPAALAALVWWLRSRLAALVFVAGGVLSLVATQVTKHLVDRPRPPTAGMPGSFDSFPSGHVANAATLALLLVLLLGVRWLRPLAVAWPAVMVLSRTVVGVHWLSDTLAAASLGAAVALATVVLARRFVPQALPARPPWPRPGRTDESGSWQVARASVRP